MQEIFWNLHIPSIPGSALRVDKVRLLLDHIRSASQSAFYPHKEVAVDETIVDFRGRVFFLQYMPKKPTKFGLKLFVLGDSSTGYVYDFILYTGSECTSQLPFAFNHLPVAKILDKGHIVFCDRYYSSVALAETLASRGTGYVGTLVRNRKDLPKEVRGKKSKLQSDEIKAWRHGKKLVVGW